MNIVEIMSRAPTFLLARVFSTPPPSPCYLPLPAVFFVSLYRLHPDSWLLLTNFWLSCLCGYAREADQGRILHLMRRCLAEDEELDELRFTVAATDAVDVSRICKRLCVWTSTVGWPFCSLFILAPFLLVYMLALGLWFFFLYVFGL